MFQIRDELHEGENIGELSKTWAKSVLKRFNKLYSNKKEEKTENKLEKKNNNSN